MSDLARITYNHGNTLTHAGMGLKTIADLLGCDGCEHHLNEVHTNGLHNAIAAIAGLVSIAGYELCMQAEIAESLDSKGGKQ